MRIDHTFTKSNSQSARKHIRWARGCVCVTANRTDRRNGRSVECECKKHEGKLCRVVINSTYRQPHSAAARSG